jgi:hypothetical protein
VRISHISSMALIGWSLLLFPMPENPGSIRGTVVNEVGAPVPAATVRVDPLDGRPMAAPVQMVETDAQGHFSMRNLDLGSYKVFAMKESLGYPNTAFAFYSGHVFPTVTLTTTTPAADVVLRVGPPAGVLTGTVKESGTDNPVSATFLLRRATDHDNWVSMSQRSTYRVLIPPNADVFLEVSAPGYKTWYRGGPPDDLKRPAIRLESRQEMRLDVQLDPEDKPRELP